MVKVKAPGVEEPHPHDAVRGLPEALRHGVPADVTAGSTSTRVTLRRTIGRGGRGPGGFAGRTQPWSGGSGGSDRRETGLLVGPAPTQDWDETYASAVVVREDRPGQRTAKGWRLALSVAQVLGRRERRVVEVVRIGGSVAVAVPGEAVPGGGDELHRSDRTIEFADHRPARRRRCPGSRSARSRRRAGSRSRRPTVWPDWLTP